MRKIVLENEILSCRSSSGKGETQLFVKQVKVEGTANRLSQRSRGRERPQGPRGDRRRARCAIEEGRQGVDRQFGLSALSAQNRGRARPSRSTPASSPKKRASTASSSCAPTPGHAAAGGPALPRSAPGRGPVPADQGDDAHPADLPFLRRRHPRSRILFLPRAGDAEASRRPPRQAGIARNGRPPARSRSPRPGAHPPPRQDWLVRTDAAKRSPNSSERPCRPAAARPPRAPPTRADPSKSPRKRRGRPKRSATPT